MTHLRWKSRTNYVAAEDGGGRELAANRSEAREWETFRICNESGLPLGLRAPNHGERITLFSYTGRRIRVRSDSWLVADSLAGEGVKVEEAVFEFVSLHSSQPRFALRAHNGKYVVPTVGVPSDPRQPLMAIGPKVDDPAATFTAEWGSPVVWLSTLHCKKTEDLTGSDSPYLHVRGYPWRQFTGWCKHRDGSHSLDPVPYPPTDRIPGILEQELPNDPCPPYYTRPMEGKLIKVRNLNDDQAERLDVGIDMWNTRASVALYDDDLLDNPDYLGTVFIDPNNYGELQEQTYRKGRAHYVLHYQIRWSSFD